MLTVDTKRVLQAVRTFRLPKDASTMTLWSDADTLTLELLTGDMHVIQTIPASGDGLARTVVSCQDLYAAMSGETAPSVTFQRDGDHLTLELGKSRTDISICGGGHMAIPVESEPYMPLGSIPVRELVKALRTVRYARSMEENAGPRTGILIESSSDGLRFVATDGHRLGCVTLEQTESNEMEAIMPGTFVETLLRLAKGGNVSFSVTGDDRNGILATGSDWSILAPMMDGDFPRYRNVIPDAMPARLSVHRKAIMGLLTSLIPQLEPVNKTVLFKRHRAGLMIEAGRERIVFEQADVSAMTTFQCNAGYLLDVLKASADEWFTLETTHTFLRYHGPAMIRDGQALHLLMPVRPALGETDELCPYCGKRFSPDAEKNPMLPWKHLACSRECAQLLEACRLNVLGNRISPRTATRLRHSA